MILIVLYFLFECCEVWFVKGIDWGLCCDLRYGVYFNNWGIFECMFN